MTIDRGHEVATMHRATIAQLIRDKGGRLSVREVRVLRQRLGLDGYEARTLRAIGTQYGLSVERIRQIEMKGLRKLGFPLNERIQRLRAFLERGR